MEATGQKRWTLSRNTVLCRKQVQPETYQSGHADRFTDTPEPVAPEGCPELRRLVSEGKNPYPRKEEMMGEVYRAECIAFGRPVETSFYLSR